MLGKAYRIDRNAFIAKLVVEMRPGATAGASDRGDDAFGRHVIAHLGLDLLGMAVEGGIAVAVVEDDHVAIAADLASIDHFSVARGMNGLSCLGGKVESVVVGTGGIAFDGIHLPWAVVRTEAAAGNGIFLGHGRGYIGASPQEDRSDEDETFQFSLLAIGGSMKQCP